MQESNKTEEAVLERAIVETIVFFDLFNYPLTGYEIYKYLKNKKFSLGQITQFLFNKKPERIQEKNGFYFLSGRESIINTRMKRYNYTNLKLKRALRVSRIFAFLPGIKMIALSNIIGSHNIREEGDIDLFIITGKNRIWISRLWCVFVAIILGLRPKPGKEKDKICLSFFISEDRMDLQDLKDKNDIYFYFWLTGLFPVYDFDYTYQKFIRCNNWLKKKLPNWQEAKINNQNNLKKNKLNSKDKILNLFLNKLENSAKKIQYKMMSEDLKAKMNQNSSVVVNNQVLKLHSLDRREEVRNNYLKKLNEFV